MSQKTFTKGKAMAVPNRFIVHQGPVIWGLLKTAARAVKQRLPGSGFHIGQNPPPLPGPTLRDTIQPLPTKMVEAYIRHTGGDVADYRNEVPPHLFPQWALPLSMQTLAEIPYPLMRIVNGGCRMEVHESLHANTPLDVSAQLLNIDDNGRRAVMHTKIITGTNAAPQAVVAHFYWIISLPQTSRDKHETRKDPAPPAAQAANKRVPEGARELDRWYLPARSGLDFARLTGDFNPIHWVPPHARAFGFKNVILHGFDAQARVFETLTRELIKSDERIAVLDVRFTRPLTLPAEVGVYIDGDAIYVGKAPGTLAYLVGSFEKTERE